MGTKIILLVITLFSFGSFSQTIDNPIPNLDNNVIGGIWYYEIGNANELSFYTFGKEAPLEYLEKLVTDNGGDFKNPSMDNVLDGKRWRKFPLENNKSIIFVDSKSRSTIFFDK